MTFIADTDVLIGYLSGHEPSAGRVALELETRELHTTAITRFELLAGAKSGHESPAYPFTRKR